MQIMCSHKRTPFITLARSVGTATYHRAEPAIIVSNAHDISPLPLGRQVSMLHRRKSDPRPLCTQ
jgi:hypothetical protein